jgi:hypothetical protein
MAPFIYDETISKGSRECLIIVQLADENFVERLVKRSGSSRCGPCVGFRYVPYSRWVEGQTGGDSGTVGNQLTDRPNGGTDRPYTLHVSPTVTDTVHTRAHA